MIRPESSRFPPSAERAAFKRELLLARQVTHKNVVRIHDLGEIDGIKYITMPYVQGEDLATISAVTGRLPLPRAPDCAAARGRSRGRTRSRRRAPRPEARQHHDDEEDDGR